MKFIHFFIFILFLLLLQPLTKTYAQEVEVEKSAIVDQYKGKPYYVHFVKKGETLTALSKAYNVPMADIVADNPSIAEGLKVDMVVLILKQDAVTDQQKEETKKETTEKTKKKFPETEEKNEAEQTKVTGNIKTPPKTEDPKKAHTPTDDKEDVIAYTVKTKESLYGIARRYKVTQEDIIKTNPGFKGLNVGMILLIPKKTLENVKKASAEDGITKVEQKNEPQHAIQEIEIQKGDSFYSIAKKHNTTVDKILELNKMKEDEVLGIGTKIKVPVSNADNSKNGKQEVTQKETKAAAADIAVLPTPSAMASTCYNSENLDKTYNVALILPLILNQSQEVMSGKVQKMAEYPTLEFIQFYGGFLTAAEMLKEYGLKVKINIIDGDRLKDTTAVVNAMKKQGMNKMSLIVGPLFANSFPYAAQFAQKNAIPIINPLSKRNNITQNNPYVIKVQPSDEGIASKLVGFIQKNYSNANVILLRKDAKELKDIVETTTKMMKASAQDGSFTGIVKEATFSGEGINGITKNITEQGKNILIFFTNNRASILTFLSQMNISLKDNANLTLLGMDSWDKYELPANVLKRCNYHQLATSYINYDDELTKVFVRNFRTKYGAMPEENKHAFTGFDIGWNFLKSLMTNGKDFEKCLENEAGKGVQFDFKFKRVSPNDGFENAAVRIVKLENYKLIQVED